MLQDRTLLEQNLIKPTLDIKRKRRIVKDIKMHLSESYAIFDGSVQSWINNPAEELKEIDSRLLFLFAEQIYLKTDKLNQDINPESFFTPAEIKASRQFSGKLLIEEEVTFPLRFHPVIQYSHYAWSTRIHIKTLVALMKSRLLNWNPESQREATYKVVNGDIIEEATLYMENVIEMKNLLKKSELENTQLTFNCSIGTANDGEEVSYNSDSYELFVNSGTKIDVIDGYHRIKAAELALAEKPDIDFYFDLKILNLTVPRAAKYLAQISKGTKISETKRKTMSKDTFTSMIIDELKKSKLGDRISKKEKLSTSRGELVTYNTLETAIDKYFKVNNKFEMFEVADYLVEIFDMLLEGYENEFITNYTETKKESLLVENNMFAGFICLASRLRSEGFKARNILKYIKQIDFSRENPAWANEYKVLDRDGRLVKDSKQNIEKLFETIEL